MTPQLPIGDVADLVHLLRANGYSVGPPQALLAQQLLLELARTGQQPASRDELHSWLCPLFANSADEQASFRKHLDEWLTSVDEATKPPHTVEPQLAGRDWNSLKRLVTWTFRLQWI